MIKTILDFCLFLSTFLWFIFTHCEFSLLLTAYSIPALIQAFSMFGQSCVMFLTTTIFFFTALYYWREWYDVHWRGHQISVEKSIRISSCFTCLRKIVDYLLSDQKDSRVCNNFDLPKYLGGKHSLFFKDFFELRKCLCFPFCLLRNTKYSITSIQNYISTYVSEYNINTEENMEEEMTLVNTIWCIGGCKKRQSLLQAPCAK